MWDSNSNHGPNDVGRAAQVFGSCYNEAMGADLTAAFLDNLRTCLVEALHPHMIILSDGLRTCARLLRDLVGYSNMNLARVPVTLDYLEVLLPSLRRTLADIKKYYDDGSLSMDLRWRTMYHKLTDEADGLPLPQRAGLYSQFLLILGQMLTRSHYFDMNALEALRNRILKLREKQGIAPPPPPPPPQAGALILASMQAAGPLAATGREIHWAEEIFSRPLPCRTPLKHLNASLSYGPWSDFRMPRNAKISFRRCFDQDRLSLIVFTYPGDEAPFIALRTLQLGTNYPLVSLRGIHELCISRDGSCLVLKRWSQSEGCSKMWAVLYFLTWEEMVLFHCTFVALKSQCYRTRQIKPEEFKLSREKRDFQARILDDRFKHSLIVYRDTESNSIRLHAAVWEGEMRQCPVWTAFVTNQARSSTWLRRKGRRHVMLRDVQLYVFCSIYREDHMRQNKSGSFEIVFSSEEAAQRFEELFYPPPATVQASLASPPVPLAVTAEAESSHGRRRARKLRPTESVVSSIVDSDSNSGSESVAESYLDSDRGSDCGSIHGPVHGSVHGSEQESLHESLPGSVPEADSVQDSLQESVHSLRESVHSLEESVHSLQESLHDSVHGSVHGSDHDSVHDSLPESVPGSARDSTEDSADMADLADSIGSVALADSTDASEVTEMKLPIES